MIYLDIETLDFFQDEHIKALPRKQQLAAIRFAAGITCRKAKPGHQLYAVHNLVSSVDGTTRPKPIIVASTSHAQAKIDAAGMLHTWNEETLVEPMSEHWQSFVTDQVGNLYWSLCFAFEPIIGWNITDFDLPVIIHSTDRAGYNPLEIEYAGLNLIDLFDMIRQTTGRWYKLEEVAQVNLGRGKLAHGQQATEWLRSGDPVQIAQALEYCTEDVRLVIDLHEKLLAGESLLLPHRPARQEINDIRWRPNAHERIPDPTGAVSTR